MLITAFHGLDLPTRLLHRGIETRHADCIELFLPAGREEIAQEGLPVPRHLGQLPAEDVLEDAATVPRDRRRPAQEVREG